jgi:PAS domain S-box-containing protein
MASSLIWTCPRTARIASSSARRGDYDPVRSVICIIERRAGRRHELGKGVVVDQAPSGDAMPGIALGAQAYGRRILAAVPGGATLAFDRDLRVLFAEGGEFERLGLDAAGMVGRRLPDVLPASSWAQLRDAYEGAVDGRTSTTDFVSRGLRYSVHASPLVSDDEIVGALVVSHSVTEQRRLQSVVDAQDMIARSSARLLETAFDRAPIGMSVVGVDGRWLRVNDAYCQMLGYEREELLGKTFRDLTHPDDVDQDVEWTQRAIGGETDSLEREKRYQRRDGSTVWMLTRSEIIRDDDGEPMYSISLLQDVTERRRSDLALHTSEQRLRSILDNTPDAVSVQDREGRYQLVNRAFEQRFGLHEAWILGRGDDEVMPADGAQRDREAHAEVLKTGEVVEREEVLPRDGEERIYVTAKFPLRDADGDIYAVGAIFNDITDRKRREIELSDRLTWTDRIHSAVSQERLVLHAQPIINLATGEVEQAELLVRMLAHHGSRELVAPGEFIPAAERFDLIAVIDQWVVARALDLAMDHRVEINLSGKTVSDPEQVAEIERLVARSGAPPQNIIFEITETAVAQNLDSARRFAQRLRAMGCSFALDDFGVGFGSFTYLKHLPVDYLKIDVAFVRDMVRDEDDRQVVTAMLGVARDFGIKTIAEGVEDQPTLELLGLMGADYAQGYFIGRPGPTEQLWPIPNDLTRTP